MFVETKAALKEAEKEAADESYSAPTSRATPAWSRRLRRPATPTRRHSSTDTAISTEVLHRIGDAFVDVPDGFTVHPKLRQMLEKRAASVREGGIDWGTGELIAFGSMLIEGTPVRLAGQDSRRGTFVQRHAVLIDKKNAAEWTPLLYLGEGQGKFWVYDSLLSEFAAMGFEYGYSVERPDALVLWEAQFGDFFNGAQTIVDEFISSSEQKWGQRSSVVLLLPHGYEGQGPTTPPPHRALPHDVRRGQHDRRLPVDARVVLPPPAPAGVRPAAPTLIVFTPKSMLRLKAASSSPEEFTNGTFLPVCRTARGDERRGHRVLIAAGKVVYDLEAEREKRGDTATALLRLEQYYLRCRRPTWPPPWRTTRGPRSSSCRTSRATRRLAVPRPQPARGAGRSR